jgi:hypothetical protein
MLRRSVKRQRQTRRCEELPAHGIDERLPRVDIAPICSGSDGGRDPQIKSIVFSLRNRSDSDEVRKSQWFGHKENSRSVED